MEDDPQSADEEEDDDRGAAFLLLRPNDGNPLDISDIGLCADASNDGGRDALDENAVPAEDDDGAPCDGVDEDVGLVILMLLLLSLVVMC
eukprot:CAMPEP_0119558344 /NCGR_PEP_ID=MMETSP1352-20130426/10643_1 /TAXON_ID=265584 /ORGANISM="Stauroneis constricta, Strain CCMP1120" /LENGTH=89 /DNA_ID=CAMNT_0007605667 /DNA_START=104 /DNA_END=373 /DNA_ORIENTATION=-